MLNEAANSQVASLASEGLLSPTSLTLDETTSPITARLRSCNLARATGELEQRKLDR